MKAGNKMYKGVEIPFNAKVQTNKVGKEFYVSGVETNKVIMRYIESGELVEVSYQTGFKYL